MAAHEQVVKLQALQYKYGTPSLFYNITPLTAAALHGHEEVVKRQLRKKDIRVNQANCNGITALVAAAYNGHEEVVQLLLQKEDIQVNHAWNDGATPLMMAAWSGYEKVVKLLLQKEDIQVNQKWKGSDTALIMAAKAGHTKVVELFLQKENLTTLLDEQATCIVCMDRKPDVVLVPCGHQSLCGPCGHQWKEQQNGGCPLDRRTVLLITTLKTED